jgi:hypothetical protein
LVIGYGLLVRGDRRDRGDRVESLLVIGYGLLRGLKVRLGVGHLIKMLPRVIISDFLCKFAA